MKNIIFCEGSTDAILLSYYLGKVVGWNYNKRLTKKIGLPIRNHENEEVYVYSKDEKELIIWAVGGQNNFHYAISHIIQANEVLERDNAYKKLIILKDRDQFEENNKILREIEDIFMDNGIKIDFKNNNDWVHYIYSNNYDEENHIEVLPIIIPFDKEGALETFILDAICEMGEEESHVVGKSKEFISGFSLTKYLNTQRLRVKGELAVALGTLFPQKTFTPIDSMLKSIRWEEYETIQNGFRKLKEI
ncbi:hypothetical protein CLTEP_16630 [Clostridium tepidiprofundi DSM 19306]|uniref:DUF3226 domain-containing protein n=1 Tax=Clostridium tepidiprofundi DSM 19306 TaxID=1121338 RepID=A0A151B3R4_9CLOT|nr:DUF3226 domain-containing protein [Clostridium tepidiprofundi]KYH34430.1 hypothetical protein CLTEP_16630 [Clostridium tepidiprofundi DSM 19306]